MASCGSLACTSATSAGASRANPYTAPANAATVGGLDIWAAGRMRNAGYGIKVTTPDPSMAPQIKKRRKAGIDLDQLRGTWHGLPSSKWRLVKLMTSATTAAVPTIHTRAPAAPTRSPAHPNTRPTSAPPRTAPRRWVNPTPTARRLSRPRKPRPMAMLTVQGECALSIPASAPTVTTATWNDTKLAAG
jgi:hypothetical protein